MSTSRRSSSSMPYPSVADDLDAVAKAIAAEALEQGSDDNLTIQIGARR